MKKINFILGLCCLLFLSACQPKDSDNAQIKDVSPSPAPKLIVSPSVTMDLTNTQKTTQSVLITANDPDKDFYIQPQSDSEPPFKRGHVQFDRKLSVNGKELELVGTTVRKFEMSSISLITIYTVGFYAPLGEDFKNDIPDVEKVLILEYHMDVPKEKVVEAIKENVYSNPTVKASEVESYFNQLSDAFDSPKKGDRYEFVYIPGRGTAMIKAGKILTLIPTHDFEKAFFGIWLSPHGTDIQMRCEILGLPCPPKNALNPVNIISSNIGGAKEKLGKLKNLVS